MLDDSAAHGNTKTSSTEMTLEITKTRRRNEDTKLSPERITEIVKYREWMEQMRAIWLLEIGIVCGLLAFAFAAIIGLNDRSYQGDFTFIEKGKKRYLHRNYLGQPFASGFNYMPVSVSEMVMDVHSAEGKSFKAFAFIAAICMLLSWYPWYLRNVHLGPYNLCFGRFGISWMNARQFLPGCGMLIVICIPVPGPANRTNDLEVFAENLHTLGALLMIGGYALCEFYTLVQACWSSYPVFRRCEWTVRMLLIVICVVGGGINELSGMLEATPLEQKPNASVPIAQRCADVYAIPTEEDFKALRRNVYDNHHWSLEQKELVIAYREKVIGDALLDNKKLLYDTASGPCLRQKYISFWSEVVSGVFMLLSHAAIWWFSPYRRRFCSGPRALPDLPIWDSPRSLSYKCDDHG